MTMGRCEHCPVRDGACKAEVDERYAAAFCKMAAGGDPSQVAAIVAASGRPAEPVPSVVGEPLAPEPAPPSAPPQDCVPCGGGKAPLPSARDRPGPAPKPAPRSPRGKR